MEVAEETSRFPLISAVCSRDQAAGEETADKHGLQSLFQTV